MKVKVDASDTESKTSKNKLRSLSKTCTSFSKSAKQESRFGNFSRYYGYRNKKGKDPRLPCMKKEWFEGKDVLDIGCNAGHFTLSIAKDFSPRVIIGVDIDKSLIKASMKNVRHYVNVYENCYLDFPISFVTNYGPFAYAVGTAEDPEKVKFPFNVSFLQLNYVLESDDLLEYQNSYFDTILCLSLTKWIHLNWGDEGLKRMLHRMYANLRVGGHLILEAQPWDSYSKKKKMTETTYKNYQRIKFFPEQFNEYLLKEVGFTSCELIDTPFHSNKGFRRPIYLFVKSKNEEMRCNVKMPRHIIFDYEDCDENIAEQEADELSD